MRWLHIELHIVIPQLYEHLIYVWFFVLNPFYLYF